MIRRKFLQTLVEVPLVGILPILCQPKPEEILSKYTGHKLKIYINEHNKTVCHVSLAHMSMKIHFNKMSTDEMIKLALAVKDNFIQVEVVDGTSGYSWLTVRL